MVRSSFPYELRIGVTGKRDAVGSALDEAVGRVFDRLADVLSDPRVTLSFVVVSPLARGGDRIVARAGLDRGARLEVIAPLPLDEYRKDFAKPEDRAEFDELLARASNRVEPPAGKVLDDRDEDYLRAGEQVIDACEIVIAVWDGKPGGKGGTADIVKLAAERARVVLWVNAVSPQMDVKRIMSYENGLIVPADFPRTAAELSRGFVEQAAYCADGAIVEAEYDAELARTTARLGKAAAEAQLSLDPALTPMVREYVRADLLARHYQRGHLRSAKYTILLAGCAVSIAAVQIVLFPGLPQLILFEVLLMVAVLWLWWRSRRRGYHDKWLRNRYFAERLRAALFTTLARAASDSQPEPTLPFYVGPRHWLSRSVAAFSRDAMPLGTMELAALKRFILLGWIDDQQAFHEANAHRKSHQYHWYESLVGVLFAATLCFALVHLLEHWLLHWKLAKGIVNVFALTLPVWGGTVHAMTAQMELERIAERSKRMARALVHIRGRIDRARDFDELRTRVEHAANLMHDEAHEWWVLLSFQDVRLHV